MSRKSPEKVYRGVKSKVAANHKSIKKAQKSQFITDTIKNYNPNETIQDIIEKSKNDYMGDKLNDSGT